MGSGGERAKKQTVCQNWNFDIPPSVGYVTLRMERWVDCVSGYDTVFAEHFAYLFEGGGHLLAGVCGHKREAYEGVVWSDSRGNHGVYEDAFVEEVAGDGECLEVVADEKRDDGSGGVAVSVSRG